MTWELNVLGANSAVPTIHRYPSGQVLNMGGQYVLIDCGEASQLRMLEYNIRKSRISTILISHMHGDHIYGLPGLLTSYNLFRRESALQIIGPHGIRDYVEYTMKITNHEFTYPINIQEITHSGNEIIFDTKKYSISAFPLVHRVPTYGYRIEEKIIRPYLSKDRIRELNLSNHQIKELLDGIEISIEGQNYVLSDVERIPTPLSYAYVSDTAYFPECAQYVNRVRLLYHEATFLDIDQKQAKERFHSTAQEAAQTAIEASADHLLLGHYSSRYPDITQFKTEAENKFQPVSLARSGKKFLIPREGLITEESIR